MTYGAKIDLLRFIWLRNLLNSSDVRRLVCHALVEMVPEQGIQDLQEALKDILEFYSISNRRSLSLPPQPPPQPIKVKIGDVIVRPVSPVTFDSE